MRIPILAAACLSLLPVPLVSAQQTGPSFDCAKARTAIEKQICKDQELATLDRTLARYYAQFYRALPPESKFRTDLRRNQVTWLRKRNRTCGRVRADDLYGCLYHAYRQRLVGLARLYHDTRGGKANRGVDFISGTYSAKEPGISGGLLILEWPDERVSGSIVTVRTNQGAHNCSLEMEKMSRNANRLVFTSADADSKNCKMTVVITGTQAQVKADNCLRKHWCGLAGFMSGRYVRAR